MAQFEYDSLVVGGGAAGLTASGISANFGCKTLMIEVHRLGGDCTWTGCIPSKTLLKAGHIARNIRKASEFGLSDTEPQIDFKKVIRHVHSVREEVYEDADRPEIYEEMGIDVEFGKASFLDKHTILIEKEDGKKREVTARYIFIATGSSPSVPAIPGLDEVDFLTSESLFETDHFPQKLIIIGGGPIGVEMAQAFSDLGSEVTILEAQDRILQKDDPEVTDILEKVMIRDGIKIMRSVDIKEVARNKDGVGIKISVEGKEQEIEGDRLFIATGRQPNVESLGLDKAGIQYSEKGIQINESCRTNISNIYAIGDVTGAYQFTHMSEHVAKIATTKALVKLPMKIDRKHVPWVTYTTPQVAHLGAREEDLKASGKKFEVYRFPYTKIDRALAENETEGLIKIFATKWTGKILGVSIAGKHAGELISEFAMAMKNGISLRNMADTIHPYPAWALGARRAADQWYIKNQSEWSVKLIRNIFGYSGDIPDYSDPDRVV